MVALTYEELTGVWTLAEMIDREKRRLKDLEVFVSSTTQVLDGMPHAKPLTFKVERLSMQMLECKETIEKLKSELIRVKFELLQRLQSFNLFELEERVLNYHYVSCLMFSEIAQIMNYTSDYVAKLHKRGLRALGVNFETVAQRKKSLSFVRNRRQSGLKRHVSP